MNSIILSNGLSSLDHLMSKEDVYGMTSDEIEILRLTEIKRSVECQYEYNINFREYCRTVGFEPNSLVQTNDLDSVPLIPSSLFKKSASALQTIRPQSFERPLYTTSSGTQGQLSRVPRDDATLMRFFASISSGVRQVLRIDNFSVPLFNLGPPTDQATDLWLSYVLAGAGLLFPSSDYVEMGEFLIDRLLDDLDRCNAPCILVGPPMLVSRLSEEVREGMRLHEHSIIVTVGGWKTHENRAVDRAQFADKTSQAFGIPPSNVRDAFNMVELNTVIFECGSGVKHIPPWLYMSTRSPRDLSPSVDEQGGILSFLDPSADSYPAYVLSGDFGSVSRSYQCDCGIQSDVLKIERRITRLESRGCAMKMNYKVGV